MELLILICPLEIQKYACYLSFVCLSYFPSGISKIIPFTVSWQTGNGIINFDMSPGNTKICLSSFIFLSQLFSFRNRQNNSISCFLAKRKWNYSCQHVPWDYTNMLVNFHFLVSAIFLQEQTKIIPFPVSWQTGNGIIHFNMSPGTPQICLPTSIFLSLLFSFRNRQK